MEYVPTEKHKKSFRDIALVHLNKILELSCDEFRGGYEEKKIRGNFVEEVYVPDSRKRISQAIEFLSYLLQPIYNKDTEDKSKLIKKEVEENLKKFNDNKITKEEFRINKLKLMKELFEQLNYLLKEKDYLRGESYEDSQGDEE